MPTTITPLQGSHIKYATLIKTDTNGDIATFSSLIQPIEWNSITWTGIGPFLSISDFVDEVQASNSDLTISLSGLPNDPDPMATVLATNYKGTKVEIYRAFYNTATEELYTSGGTYGPFLRFKGYVTNYSITEEVEPFSKERTNTITLNVASIHRILENKITGRRTNDRDMRKFFPNDPSMSRITTLQNTTFNFGK
jgi:hypothetical protein